MQHAEAHERLSDLALEPGRLARLETDPSPESAALREHMAGCERCSADLAGWRRTWTELGAALGDEAAGTTRAGTVEAGAGPGSQRSFAIDRDPGAVRAPARLRARTLAAIVAERRATEDAATAAATAATAATTAAATATAATAATAATTTAMSSAPGAPAEASVDEPAGARPLSGDRVTPFRRLRASRSLPWLATAAAIIVAVVAGSFAWSRSTQVSQLQARTAELEAVAATFDRVLAAPKHWAVTLRAADGAPGGTLAWSAQEIVVVTTGLPAPGAGQAYRCWVEQNGVRTPMGVMTWSGATGYWLGSMYSSGESFGPGARYGVSLVPDGGQGTPVLIGSL